MSGATLTNVIVPLWLAKLGAPFLEAAGYIRGKQPLYTRASLYALSAYYQVSAAKAQRAFGYAPRPFEETVHDCVRWFAENGYLSKDIAQRVLEGAS